MEFVVKKCPHVQVEDLDFLVTPRRPSKETLKGCSRTKTHAEAALRQMSFIYLHNDNFVV
jgi:hypothetical protein